MENVKGRSCLGEFTVIYTPEDECYPGLKMAGDERLRACLLDMSIHSVGELLCFLKAKARKRPDKNMPGPLNCFPSALFI